MDETIYWAAILDNKIYATRRSKRTAEADAAWLRAHPSTLDRRRFGHGGRVAVSRVRECEWVAGDWIALDVAPPESQIVHR